MRETREHFDRLRDEARTTIKTTYAHLDDEQIIPYMREEYSRVLFEMRKNEIQKYMSCLRICSFFETVGLMVKKEYVSQQTVISLYKGPIIQMDHMFRFHISKRQNEEGMPKGLFEHAIYLADLASNYD